MTEQKIKNTTWISLVKPTAHTLKNLRERFPRLHSLVLEDLESPTIRPAHVEIYENHVYAVFHFPNFLERRDVTLSHEIDFIMIEDALITIEYEGGETIKKLWKEISEEPALQDQYGKTPVHLLHYILTEFFRFSLKELDQIQEKIDGIEDDVFAGHEKEILQKISLLRRNVLDFRRAIKPQHLTLESLTVHGTLLYGEKVRPFLIELTGEYLKVWDLLENHKDALDALYETNNALLTSRINEIMRAFTVLAFITFIPTVIANIYGMNIAHMPLIDRPNAFFVIILLMIGVTTLAYLALKWKKLV